MQEVESEENSFGIATRDIQVTGIRGTDGKEYVIEIAVDVFRRDVLADFGIADELDSGFFEQFHSAVDDGLVEFPVRDSVTQEAADLVALFIDGDGKAFTAECLGGEKS